MTVASLPCFARGLDKLQETHTTVTPLHRSKSCVSTRPLPRRYSTAEIMSIKRKQEDLHLDDQEEGDEPVTKKVSDDKGMTEHSIVHSKIIEMNLFLNLQQKACASGTAILLYHVYNTFSMTSGNLSHILTNSYRAARLLHPVVTVPTTKV